MNDNKHIFISYARENRARVAVLARLFEAEGWSVWWDRDNLPAGKQFDRIIDQAIEDAACVLVCWSGGAVASGWVIAEANEALEQNKLLPVFLETVRPPLRFRPYHAIDFSTWDERVSHEAYQRLKAELQRWQPLSGNRSVDEGIGAIEAASEPAIVEDTQPPQDSLAKDQLTPEARKLLGELELPETEPKRRLDIGNQLNEMEGGDPRFGVGLNAHAPSPEGLMDLTGNVWEWCRNDHSKPDGEIDLPGSPVLRGGSRGYNPQYARAASVSTGTIPTTVTSISVFGRCVRPIMSLCPLAAGPPCRADFTMWFPGAFHRMPG